MRPPFTLTGSEWLDALIVMAVAVTLALTLYLVVSLVLGRTFRSRPTALLFLRHLRAPARWIVAFMAIELAWQATAPDLPYRAALLHATHLLLIAGATWLSVNAVTALSEVVLILHAPSGADDMSVRRVRTQAKIIARTFKVFAVVVGVSVALMTFPEVRRFGTTLLASAGVAGLVVGLAARPVFGNIVAGLQIALSQPIRMDDVVIVEGEWGRIEEIMAAFVIVKTWDERRLIVPLQRFIEKPFQNWTRGSSQLLGTFFVYLDYGMPVAALREEFLRLVKAAPEWDGRAAALQVTDFKEGTMQVRALASAADAGKSFDLMCRLREQLVDFVQREYPQHLPHARATAEIRAEVAVAATGGG